MPIVDENEARDRLDQKMAKFVLNVEKKGRGPSKKRMISDIVPTLSTM